jgi:hypothetical protein
MSSSYLLFISLSLFIFHTIIRAASCSGGGDGGGSRLVLLKLSSLFSALLALAAKENGIAALPVCITWDVIRHTRCSSSRSSRPSLTRRQGKLNNNNNSLSSSSVESHLLLLLLSKLKNRTTLLVSITTVTN